MRLLVATTSVTEFSALNDNDGLPAGTTDGRPQTAGNLVKPNFRSLNLDSVFIRSDSPVDSADDLFSEQLRLSQLLQMKGDMKLIM